MVWYAPCMVCRGKNALEKNRAMNSSGKLPCTASDDPVFKAIDAVNPPMAIPVNAPHSTITTTPGTPDLMVTPNGSSTTMKNSAWNAPNNAAPASRPTKMLTRDVGVAKRRSKKPFSMSVAKAAPPVTLPNSTPWTMLPARAKLRKLSTAGNPGSRVARLNDELLERGEEQREDQRWGDERRLAQDGDDRPLRHRHDLGDTAAATGGVGSEDRGHLRRRFLPTGAGPPASVIAVAAPSSR